MDLIGYLFVLIPFILLGLTVLNLKNENAELKNEIIFLDEMDKENRKYIESQENQIDKLFYTIYYDKQNDTIVIFENLIELGEYK